MPLLNCAAARGIDLALVTVAITGHVEFSNLAPSLGVKVGDPVKMSFLTLPSPVDRIAGDGSGVHLLDGMAPYLMCNETFSLSIGKITGKLGAAVPDTVTGLVTPDTYFSLSSKRPVHDAIFMSTAAATPAPLPVLLDTKKLYDFDLVTKTPAGHFMLDFALDYTRDTLPSLHMKQASSKSYTGKGLLRSDFSLYWSFPTNVVVRVKLDAVDITYPTDER